MTALRLIAIALIFLIAAGAWVVLGASVDIRTGTQDRELHQKVGGLWGQAQVQRPPSVDATIPRRVPTEKGGHRWISEPVRGLGIVKSDVDAALELDQRMKGLLWYATYAVAFNGAYRVENPASRVAETHLRFAFPNPEGVYDGFAVKVDGREVPVTFGGGSASASFEVPAKGASVVEIGYRTQGLDSWTYAPTDGIGAVKDFTLTIRTDFKSVDFPDGAVSPTSKTPTAKGWDLVWHYASLISGRQIALTMPKPTNPGPLAARISLFAPVSLLFFFAALVLNTVTNKVRVHPMNYAFLAAGFFAFHLLFVYLVDRVDINVAFLAASATSVALCVGYLYLVIGPGRTLVETAVSQFVFLVLFSYSFFFEGYTGLAITIGAILTLAFFMAKTGRTDWDEAFGRGRPQPPAAVGA